MLEEENTLEVALQRGPSEPQSDGQEGNGRERRRPMGRPARRPHGKAGDGHERQEGAPGWREAIDDGEVREQRERNAERDCERGEPALAPLGGHFVLRSVLCFFFKQKTAYEIGQ